MGGNGVCCEVSLRPIPGLRSEQVLSYGITCRTVFFSSLLFGWPDYTLAGNAEISTAGEQYVTSHH